MEGDCTPLLPISKSDGEKQIHYVDRKTENQLLKSDQKESSLDSLTVKRSYNRWSPTKEGVTLAWSDLSICATGKKNRRTTYKRIINNVTGVVKAGTMVALMGSSGSGKSTLMSALAYKSSGNVNVEGDILINGRPIGNYMRQISGFMHQDEIFVGSLTVLEHMNIMAFLKLDRRTTCVERKSKIYCLLKELGLLQCLNTKIGAIGLNKTLSGGERKRLAFATEMLTDPPILFCDEPTTGLDSYSAQNIVNMMNSMVAKGKTILCTIHQPSSDIFAMFSQIILLSEGRIAYMGSASGATTFFHSLGYACPTSYNPADFFIKTLATTPGYEESSKQTIKRICDHFSVSDYTKEVDVVIQYEFHMGRSLQTDCCVTKEDFKECFWWSKILWLTYRWFLDILRNPHIQAMRLLQKIGIALMVGGCYFGTQATTQSGIQSIQGAIFLLVTENTFTPMYAVLAEFSQYYVLFLREYKSGMYSPFVYYMSRILAMVPGLLVEPTIFVLIVYWLSGLRSTLYAYFFTTLAAIMTMIVSNACGVFFSIAFGSVPTALAYLVPFDYVLFTTSGLFVKLSTISNVMSWTKYLSWLMYSTELISIVQWQAVRNITCDVISDIPCLENGTQILDKYSFSEDNFVRDFVNMGILCMVFYLLGFITLLHKTKTTYV